MLDLLATAEDTTIPHVYLGEKSGGQIQVHMSHSLLAMVTLAKERYDPIFHFNADVVRSATLMFCHALINMDSGFPALASRIVNTERILNRELLEVENVKRVSDYIDRLQTLVAWFLESGRAPEAWQLVREMVKTAAAEPSYTWRRAFFTKLRKVYTTFEPTFRSLADRGQIEGFEPVKAALEENGG